MEEPDFSWEQNVLELVGAQRTRLLSIQGKGLAAHLGYTCLYKIIVIQGPGSLLDEAQMVFCFVLFLPALQRNGAERKPELSRTHYPSPSQSPHFSLLGRESRWV